MLRSMVAGSDIGIELAINVLPIARSHDGHVALVSEREEDPLTSRVPSSPGA